MRRHLIIGQLICLTGLLLLLATIPFMPRVTGLPRHRVAEMCGFWGAQWMLVIGTWISLRAHSPEGLSQTQRRNSVLAAAGVMIAIAVCFVSLSNLTFSSVQGAGLRMPGTRSGRLFPRELGYLLALPLLASIGLQFPIFGSIQKCGLSPPGKRPVRSARLILQIMLLILSAMFVATILAFIVDRWFAVVSVVTTWLATLLFFGVSIEQLAFAKSNGLVRV